MPRHPHLRRAEAFCFLALISAALAPGRGEAAETASRPLQLEVYINDAPTKLIAAFVQFGDRRIAACRAELTEIGLKAPGAGASDALVAIDELSNVAYRYDEPSQKIFFKVGDEGRITRLYDLSGGVEGAAPATADYGSVLNYSLFAATTKSFETGVVAFSGGNATLDARWFGPYGTLGQSAIVGTTIARSFDTLRLDTTWTYSDSQSMLVYRAGDLISGGLSWSRPIRVGGVQLQRNFALRPDLVTLPLPTVSGSAAVPSTLDVYVDNVKAHSQDLPSGPYQLTNLPVLTGAGTARVVVRDAAGRQTETALPFYASPKLLKQGFLDFSVEAGVPRMFYGTESNSYVANTIGSASVRSGLSDWLTAEGHFESGAGVLNGGLGAVTNIGNLGILSLAASASRFGDNFGYQSYVAYDTTFMEMHIHASSLRTFASYNDLASAAARYVPKFAASPVGYLALLTSTRPPKSLDTISVGFPLPLEKSWLNVGYVRLDLDPAKHSDIVTVSYSRPLFGDATLSVTAFANLSDRKSGGIFCGLSIPLGDLASASTSVSSTPKTTNVAFDAARSMPPEPGGYGWRLHDSEGNASTTSRLAAGTYRSSVAQFEGTVRQDGRTSGASMQAEGAIAAMGGGVFPSNRIDDSFAVIDAGMPKVEVLYENRPAGKTDAKGLLLIPSLRSYQKNKISIDPRDLPVDAEAPTTQSVVAPADRSGILVNFGVKTDIKAAVVILSDKAGKFVTPGSHGRLEGSNQDFVVGYDGRAYIKGLGTFNTIVVVGDAGECRASFPFSAQKNTQVVVGPLSCL